MRIPPGPHFLALVTKLFLQSQVQSLQHRGEARATQGKFASISHTHHNTSQAVIEPRQALRECSRQQARFQAMACGLASDAASNQPGCRLTCRAHFESSGVTNQSVRALSPPRPWQPPAPRDAASAFCARCCGVTAAHRRAAAAALREWRWSCCCRCWSKAARTRLGQRLVSPMPQRNPVRVPAKLRWSWGLLTCSSSVPQLTLPACLPGELVRRPIAWQACNPRSSSPHAHRDKHTTARECAGVRCNNPDAAGAAHQQQARVCPNGLPASGDGCRTAGGSTAPCRNGGGAAGGGQP